VLLADTSSLRAGRIHASSLPALDGGRGGAARRAVTAVEGTDMEEGATEEGGGARPRPRPPLRCAALPLPRLPSDETTVSAYPSGRPHAACAAAACDWDDGDSGAPSCS
jgi:hypothetical protein